jgi:hypothetical protein
MPIKEEPIEIKFHYESPETEKGAKYICDVSCDTTISPVKLKIVEKVDTGKSQVITLPLDFVVEAVDFLRKKGAVSFPPPAEVRGVASVVHPSIPIPVIEKKDTESQAAPKIARSDASPFSSFSTGGEEEAKVIKSADDAPIGEQKIKIGEKEVQLNDVEMQKRTVIRTADIADENNPRAVEDNAAAQRNSKKSKENLIKRVEDEI